jgi:hypothetical protein
MDPVRIVLLAATNVEIDRSKMDEVSLAVIHELMKPKDEISKLLAVATESDIPIEFASMYIPGASSSKELKSISEQGIGREFGTSTPRYHTSQKIKVGGRRVPCSVWVLLMLEEGAGAPSASALRAKGAGGLVGGSPLKFLAAAVAALALDLSVIFGWFTPTGWILPASLAVSLVLALALYLWRRSVGLRKVWGAVAAGIAFLSYLAVLWQGGLI